QCRYVLGEVQRSRAEFDKAIEQYSNAENLQKQIRDPELGWRVLYGRGQSLEAQGKFVDAISAYQNAINIIEETRSQSSEERYRAGYIQDRYQGYVTLVELLLKLGKTEEAFFYSEKWRARSYFDQLRTTASVEIESDAQHHLRELAERIRSLRHAIEKEYAAPEKERRGQALDLYSAELNRAEKDYQELLDNGRNSDRESSARSQAIPSVSEIQRLLPPETALIEFVVGKQSVSTLLITPSSVVGIPIQISSDSLSSRIELLRGLILSRSPEWIQPAKGIFQLLFVPLDANPILKRTHQLLIIPDGVLNYVPFAALPNARGRFLGDQYNISYLPSAVALVADPFENSNGRKLLAMAPS